MTNRIVVLVNNSAGPDLGSEHGFALYIECDGRNILLDTGQGLTLADNARRLGINLAGLDTLVVSHGHYDHTGGFPQLLEAADRPDLFLHPAAVQPRYAVRDATARAIQMPQAAMAAIDALPEEKVHWVTSPVQLSPSIGITGPIPRETGFEDPGGPFFLDPHGLRPDLIEDDQALWITTARGLVVCVGCCHAGLINTLRYVRRVSGQNKIHGVVGGLHLLNAGQERLERTLAELVEIKPAWIMPCHCTGTAAVTALTEKLGDRVRSCHAGVALTL